MNYRGVIIEESLESKDIFTTLQILRPKMKPVTEMHKPPWLAQWTLHSVEIPEDQAASLFVIFRDKVFKVDRENQSHYDEVVKFGLALGIPDYQLGFSPAIEDWQRVG